MERVHRRLRLLVTYALALVAACHHGGGPIPAAHLAITNVTVVDVAGGTLLADQTVLVGGTRIAAMGAARSIPLRDGVRVVDGRGKFLIPGLWDMHVHSGGYANGRRHLPALLAHGITGVRDMGTPLEDVLRLRDESRGGTLIAPRMLVAGPLLNGPLPFRTPLILSVATEADARAAVGRLAESGVDVLKVHDALPRELYFPIADEAKRRGIPFAGHIPSSITAAEATRAGQRSVEHLGGRFYGELLACSAREPELRALIARIVESALRDLQAGREPDAAAVFRASLTGPLVESFSELREQSRIAAIVAAGTWEVPTLVSQPVRDALRDTSLQLTADDRRYARALVALQARFVRDMVRAGARVMAGTDRDIARPALAEELQLLVGAGLTPAEALRAATIAPASYMGATDSLGAVAPGKLADLVLLDGDPLRDIGSVARVHAVVANGRLLEEPDLRRLLQAAAGSKPP